MEIADWQNKNEAIKNRLVIHYKTNKCIHKQLPVRQLMIHVTGDIPKSVLCASDVESVQGESCQFQIMFVITKCLHLVIHNITDYLMFRVTNISVPGQTFEKLYLETTKKNRDFQYQMSGKIPFGFELLKFAIMYLYI